MMSSNTWWSGRCRVSSESQSGSWSSGGLTPHRNVPGVLPSERNQAMEASTVRGVLVGGTEKGSEGSGLQWIRKTVRLRAFTGKAVMGVLLGALRASRSLNLPAQGPHVCVQITHD